MLYIFSNEDKLHILWKIFMNNYNEYSNFLYIFLPNKTLLNKIRYKLTIGNEMVSFFFQFEWRV